MAAIDMARGRYYTDADIDSPPAESPVRERMGPNDHLNADQFAGVGQVARAPAARHPHHIDGLSVHAWRSRTNPTRSNP
jgi:hypothetical protein